MKTLKNWHVQQYLPTTANNINCNLLNNSCKSPTISVDPNGMYERKQSVYCIVWREATKITSQRDDNYDSHNQYWHTNKNPENSRRKMHQCQSIWEISTEKIQNELNKHSVILDSPVMHPPKWKMSRKLLPQPQCYSHEHTYVIIQMEHYT